MEVVEVQAIPGRAVNSTIIHVGDGYYYHVREVRPRRIRLKCRHLKGGCRANACLFIHGGDLKLQLNSPHSCRRDPLLLEDSRLRAEVVAEARTSVTGASVRKLLRDFRLRLHPDLASRFTVARMHSALHTARSSNYPKLPKTLLYLGILLGLPNMQAVCKTSDGTDYIFQGVVGTRADKTISVFFASGRMLELLQTTPNLHMDGTFKKRPRKPRCRQVYNIVTNNGGSIIALVRVLMRSRSELAYLTLFRHLKTLAPNLEPRTIHCDFEKATMNALRTVFPTSTIVGCLWHYGVCVGRKAGKLNLSSLASQNDLVHSYIRCISGVPLLPSTLISPTIEELWTEVESSGWADTFEPLFSYFRREWVPKAEQLTVFNHEERTNNCSESDNRSLANVVPQNRPNIWALVGGFVQLEHLAWSDLTAVQRGLAVSCPRRWKTVANDQRIERLTELLNRDGIVPLAFLKQASWVNQGALNHGMQADQDSGSDTSSSSDSDSDSS